MHTLLSIPESEPMPAHPVEDCIDAHLALGVDHMVWDCGRSVLGYRSDLPGRESINGERFHIPAAVMARCPAMLAGDFCPLRRAIAHGHEQGMAILGRLTINRHYGAQNHPGATSRFADSHKEYWEVDRTPGWGRNPSRLCFAIEAVRQERIEVLLEIQRIGIDALVLDFCRQPPMLLYHPALVDPYIARTGRDPRAIDSDRPEDYGEWFQYRADVMTGFMQELRAAVQTQEKELGRPCPIIARIPDNAPWLNISYGIDAPAWLEQDLADALMLSPFPLAIEDPGRYPEYYIELAHSYGKACFGGLGSMGLLCKGDPHSDPQARKQSRPDVYQERPVYEILDQQLQAGADGITLYQSEQMVREPHLQELIPQVGNKAMVAEQARQLAASEPPADHYVGTDWHSSWLDEDGPHGQLLSLRTPEFELPNGWRML